MNKAQFTCETRTFQDAEAQGQLRPKAVKPGLGNENGKEESRVSDIMRKIWLQDQPGEQQLLPKEPRVPENEGQI